QWIGMATVVINVFDSEAGTTSEYSFNKSPIRLGRNPLNDLTLPFPFVSGWHAVVRFDEHEAKFFDLGSTNGTLHNGRRIQAGEPVFVDGNVALTIGKLELRISRRAGDVVAHSVPPPPPFPSHGFPEGSFVPTRELQAQVPPPPPVSVPPVGGLRSNWSPLPSHGSAAPSSDSTPPGMGTAHVEMSDVHQLVHRLRPSYENFRKGWRSMSADLANALGAMAPQLRPFAMSILQREFPETAKEPEFAAMVAQYGGSISDPTARPSTGAGTELGVVAGVARSLCPDEDPPTNAIEVQRFLAGVEDVLRACAKAFVELQKGQEEFGNQMGVRTIKEYTALHAAGTPEKVLKYLLDWRNGGPHRTQELVGVYADTMIHQVALLNGIMAGIRSLLARLSPEEIERRVTAGWPTRASAVWKQYTERYRDLTAEDKSIVAVVFGREFARAYAEVGGEGGDSTPR